MPVCEAGYERFRLAGRLEGEDLEVVVCDPASLEVVRRRKKAKTDRIDAGKTVRAPVARDGGDRDAMSPVRVPTVAEEDAKRLLRRRERLVKERLRLASAVAGLLRLHGVPPGDPAKAGFRDRLAGTVTGYGTALPPGLLAEVAGIPGRLEPGVAELRTVEAEKAAAREARDVPEDGGAEAAVPAHARHAAVLVRLRGIGPNDALLPGAELLYRDLRNRRELAGMAGLAPVPWASGAVDHDQGTGKAGSPMLRKHLVQMAWRWLRHQPDSALSGWFRGYVSARDGRSGKRGIVALARRLLVAPGGSPRQGRCPRAPSCRRHGRKEDRNTRAARRGPRGSRAGRVTVLEHGSPRPQAAAPSAQMGPAPRNVAPPEPGTVVTGPAHRPADRTGQHPCLGSSPDPAFSGCRDRGFPQPVHIPAAVRAGAGGPAARARPDGWFPSGPGGPPGGAARPGVRRRPPTCPPRCAGRGAAHSR